MNILVTGGAGFLGSHLVDKLLKLKHQVVIIDNLSSGKKKFISGGDFYKLDIKSDKIETIFKKYKFDIVFHLAAQKSVPYSINNPQFDAKNNILGSLNLLDNGVKYKIKKFIFTSTGGAIYDQAQKFPTSETEKAKPVSPYAIAKFAVEKYIEFYGQIKNLPYIILRPANIYGPRQDPKGEAGVVAIFINNLLNNKQSYINGTGKQTRDFVYVKDVVNALIKSTKAKNKIYNISTAKDIDINKLYQKIALVMNITKKPLHKLAIRGEVQKSQLSYARIKKELKWQPQYSLEKGLMETIEYFKNNE